MDLPKLEELANDYVYRATGIAWLDELFNGDARPYYRFLFKLAQEIKPKTIVEIGVQRGHSLAHLACGAIKAKVVGIDPVKWEDVRSIMAKCRNISFYKSHSQNVDVSRLPEIDILFIDGEHTYEQVRTEWKYYSPKVKKGGLIIFDDIHLNAGMERVWKELRQKGLFSIDLSHLHVSGFGVIGK